MTGGLQSASGIAKSVSRLKVIWKNTYKLHPDFSGEGKEERQPGM